MKIVKLTTETSKYRDSLKNVRELSIKEDKLEQFVKNPNNLAYMAIENDMVIGFAWAYIQERLDDENMMYIHSVDVLPSYQNKGIGTKLIETFLEYAKKKQFRNTFLITDKNNIAANKLYSKFTEEIEKDKILYIFR